MMVVWCRRRRRRRAPPPVGVGVAWLCLGFWLRTISLCTVTPTTGALTTSDDVTTESYV